MPRRPSHIHPALLIALALVVTSCTDEPRVLRKAAAALVCPDREFGCVDVGPGEPIKIGTLLVISGENASLGRDSQNGAHLASDFLKEPGQILGHDIQWVDENETCSAEGGADGAREFAGDPGVVAVIGTSCSTAALGVADVILSEKGIVLISPSNTDPALTDPAKHQPFYLRTAHNDRLQGVAMAEFAFNEVGWKRASTIHDGSPYADGLQQAFADTFASFGGTIARQEAIQVGETDFKPLLTDLAADRIDGLYFPIFVAEGGLITAQARTVPGLKDTDLAGANGMFTPDWIEAAGAEKAEGVYISGPDLTVLADPDFYENEFLPAYQDKFGEEPQSVFHPHAFDAAMLVFGAIQKVAIRKLDGSLLIARTKLRDALYATKNFPGISGTLSCDKNGDCQPEAKIAIRQITNGDFGGEYELLTPSLDA